MLSEIEVLYDLLHKKCAEAQDAIRDIQITLSDKLRLMEVANEESIHKVEDGGCGGDDRNVDPESARLSAAPDGAARRIEPVGRGGDPRPDQEAGESVVVGEQPLPEALRQEDQARHDQEVAWNHKLQIIRYSMSDAEYCDWLTRIMVEYLSSLTAQNQTATIAVPDTVNATYLNARHAYTDYP